jgi:GT2 family glycosyltransferase
MRASPRVCAVVLNWNRFDHTRRCVESLQACGYPDLRIVVVDNASADGSGARLRATLPGVTFMQNAANLGFARGCNVGIRRALEDPECAFVLLINNDATLAPDGLAAAVQAAGRDPLAGVVGGKVLESPESRKIWYAGGYVDRWRGQAMVRGFGEIDTGQYDAAGEVGFATGGLMLIRRRVLERVGLLPEEYFFGVEEWDFSLSVRRAGLRLLYVSTFLAYHAGDGSHWNYSPKYVYNYYRNKLIFQQKFLPHGLFPLWKLAFALYGVLLARRHRQELIRRGGETRAVQQDDLDFALREALKDHGRNVLSEEVLTEFEQRLAARHAALKETP